MKVHTCEVCHGRGGLGHSCGGVTLSYQICYNCDGEGVFLEAENKEEEKVRTQ